MNRQPYQTPPRWWSPRLSPRWTRFWRPFRRHWAAWKLGLAGVQLHADHHVREALESGHGILLAPNHPAHLDPYAMMEASDQLGIPFYFMTAWQVFAMNHWVGHRVLRQHGCFSINREGHDLRAFRQAVRILEGERPLVIFPEGEVFHLNDRVTHFRRGAATAALRAARRSGRPVACLPTAIKYRYVQDLGPSLLKLMNRLERRVGLSPRTEMPLARRILRVADSALGTKELEYFGAIQSGSKDERRQKLVAALLGRLEDRYRVLAPQSTVPERVKELRRRAIATFESAPRGEAREQAQRDLDDLFCATQLFSYPADYLASNPSLERLAETLDKLEEDVLQVTTAQRRGVRRAIVAFGEPVLAQPHAEPKSAAAAITETLEWRVQSLLDELNAARAPVSSAPRTAPAAGMMPIPEAEAWNLLPEVA